MQLHQLLPQPTRRVAAAAAAGGTSTHPLAALLELAPYLHTMAALQLLAGCSKQLPLLPSAWRALTAPASAQQQRHQSAAAGTVIVEDDAHGLTEASIPRAVWDCLHQLRAAGAAALRLHQPTAHRQQPPGMLCALADSAVHLHHLLLLLQAMKSFWWAALCVTCCWGLSPRTGMC